MPQLIFKHFSIPFKEINETALHNMPMVLQPAAQLIYDWNNGKTEFLLHTSGSTGAPKPIILDREKIVFSANLTAEAFALKAGNTLLCCLGTNYVAGFMMVMRALVLNCNLVVTEATGNPLKNAPADTKIDFVSFVPLQIQSIFEDGHIWIEKLNAIGAILLGGGSVSASLLEKIKSLQVPVYQSYATTETYTHVALRQLNGPNASEFYKALPGVILATDERTCLTISSYITDFKTLKTNDIVEFNSNDEFRWLGRFDNIINSGGIKINPEEVEEAFKMAVNKLGLPEINVLAFGLPDEKLGEKLVLVVEGQAFNSETEAEILLQMQQCGITKYKLPKQFFYLQQFPKTHTGKTDRNAVLKSIK